MVSSLSFLDLSNQAVVELPEAVSQDKALLRLNVAGNRLSEDSLKSIFTLFALQFLDLSANGLEVVPKEVAHLQNLQTLVLHKNRLQTLPDTLCKLKKLIQLWLSENAFTKIPEAVWGLPSHCSIDLSNNPLSKEVFDVLQMRKNTPGYLGPGWIELDVKS